MSLGLNTAWTWSIAFSIIPFSKMSPWSREFLGVIQPLLWSWQLWQSRLLKWLPSSVGLEHLWQLQLKYLLSWNQKTETVVIQTTDLFSILAACWCCTLCISLIFDQFIWLLIWQYTSTSPLPGLSPLHLVFLKQCLEIYFNLFR